nr:hypothetical protein [Tanacetum cinerariifolium]
MFPEVVLFESAIFCIASLRAKSASRVTETLFNVLRRTDAKYRVDQTRSTRFEDELIKERYDDVFEAGEEMDKDIQEPDIEETQTHHSTKHTPLQMLFPLSIRLLKAKFRTPPQSLKLQTVWKLSIFKVFNKGSLPLRKLRFDIEMIGSSTQPTGPVIDITLPESPPAAPKADRGKGKVTDDDKSSPNKLVKSSTVAHYELEERNQKASKEANLLEMTKPELIKVVYEEATKARVDPKILASAKGDQEFRKIQDVEIKVHNREHSENIKRSRELRKKRIEKYLWTTSSRLKPETI